MSIEKKLILGNIIVFLNCQVSFVISWQLWQSTRQSQKMTDSHKKWQCLSLIHRCCSLCVQILFLSESHSVNTDRTDCPCFLVDSHIVNDKKEFIYDFVHLSRTIRLFSGQSYCQWQERVYLWLCPFVTDNKTKYLTCRMFYVIELQNKLAQSTSCKIEYFKIFKIILKCEVISIWNVK